MGLEWNVPYPPDQTTSGLTRRLNNPNYANNLTLTTEFGLTRIRSEKLTH